MRHFDTAYAASANIPVAHCAYHSPTVEVLPDNVLLEIFDLDRLSSTGRSWEHPWQWNRLIHVCQRWRCLIFSSPRRLDLRLFCSNGTPVKETLRFWPELPIVMRYGGVPKSKPPSPEEEENLVTALRQPDRIYEIWLTITASLWDQLAAEMQRTMPSLETLKLMAQDMPELLLPDDFLGGSAPHLSVINLNGVAFPALPKLLLSTSNLVSLELWEIPRSGYITPEALTMGLSAMTQLKSLTIYFDFTMSRSHIPTPSLGHMVLPALTRLKFYGVIKYLEAIVARIDTPLLDHADLKFFDTLAFEIPHLSHFIRRTSQLGSPTHAQIASSGIGFSLGLFHLPRTPTTTISRRLRLQITCMHFNGQLSAIPPISSQLSPFLSGVRLLELYAFPSLPNGSKDIDSARWVELLQPFSKVEKLCVAAEVVLDIARVLQRVTAEPDLELLPALRALLLENSREFTDAREVITPFMSARELSGHPIILRNWIKKG